MNDSLSTLHLMSWDHNLPEGFQSPHQDALLSSTLADLDAAGAMELLFANSAMWDSVENWDFQATEGAAV